MTPTPTTVTFVGTGSLLPRPGHDVVCCVINRRIMVDTGYYGAMRLSSMGLSVAEIDHLVITHDHPDHTLGLPLLVCQRNALPFVGAQVPELTVIGPVGHVESIVGRTCTYMGIAEPNGLGRVVALGAGDEYETETFALRTVAACHADGALLYRFTDKRTGAQIGLAWDTSPSRSIAEHMRGVDLLIHDANRGAAKDTTEGAHSSAGDAARCACDAGVGRLALVHSDDEAASVAAAREIFSDTFWPQEGQTVEVRHDAEENERT